MHAHGLGVCTCVHECASVRESENYCQPNLEENLVGSSDKAKDIYSSYRMYVCNMS